MKKYFLLTATLFYFLKSYALPGDSLIHVIPSKTVLLIFPDSLAYVDLALSEDVLSSRMSGTKCYLNCYQDFKVSTSMIVETTTGDIYSFIIKFGEPKKLIIPISRKQVTYKDENLVALKSHQVQTTKPEVEEELIKESESRPAKKSSTAGKSPVTKITDKNAAGPYKNQCEQILLRSMTVNGCGKRDGQMIVVLQSIHIQHGKLFFKVYLENKANLKFDINFFKFTKIDKSKVASTKDESGQGDEIVPIYIYNDYIKTIEGKRQLQRVYVFDKFTIDTNEEILVETGEEVGRLIQFSIPSKEVLNARSI